jgi:hypothetical protein
MEPSETKLEFSITPKELAATTPGKADVTVHFPALNVAMSAQAAGAPNATKATPIKARRHDDVNLFTLPSPEIGPPAGLWGYLIEAAYFRPAAIIAFRLGGLSSGPQHRRAG